MTAEYLVFDFADETTLLDKDRILRLLIAICAGDVYKCLKKAIVCDDSPGLIYVPNSPETLANAWNNAIRAEQRYNGYWMEFENDQKLKFSFGFDPNAGRRLFLTAKRADLRSDDALREFVRFGEMIFNTLHPLYGFGMFSYDNHETPEIGAAPAALWDYNFFGAELIDTLGHDKIDAASAFRKAELDGGVLIEVAANPITRPQIKHYREASAALGFSKYYQGG